MSSPIRCNLVRKRGSILASSFWLALFASTNSNSHKPCLQPLNATNNFSTMSTFVLAIVSFSTLHLVLFAVLPTRSSEMQQHRDERKRMGWMRASSQHGDEWRRWQKVFVESGYYARNWFILFKNWNICCRLSLGYLLQNPTQQRRKSNQNIASSYGCLWVGWVDECCVRLTLAKCVQIETYTFSSFLAKMEQRQRSKWKKS